MIKTVLKDGRGGGSIAQVTERGHALCSTTIPPDPRDLGFEVMHIEHWESGYFTDGAASPSQDLTINGATTPTDFGVFSQQDRHTYIEKVVFTIHSSGMKLDSNEIRQFGAAGVLTNGLDLTYNFQGEVFNIFGGGVTVLSEMYRYFDDVTGVTDGISAGVDFVVATKRFPRPLPLQSRSTDQLTISVTDNLSSLTLFEVQFEGYHINDGGDS